MTVYRRGDIVLVPFDFTDGSGAKVRPAIVVSTDAYNNGSPDVIIASITGNLQAAPHVGDQSVIDWKRAGLLKPSLAQAKLATVESAALVRKLGRLSARDLSAFEQGLREALGL